MERKNGYFVVTLDFELFWGMFDVQTLQEYGANILGERTAIPRMLELFRQYDIHATWATVGMLMARSRAGLMSLLPPKELRPKYKDARISTYHHIETDVIGDSEADDPYHFGQKLVEAILATPHQHIGNHTFSHFYCIDGDMNNERVFAADLDAHHTIASTYGVTTTTMVFPRNQWSEEALRVCESKGIRAYRGNENHFFYRARVKKEQSLFIRGLRLLDHYINISGHHTYPLPSSTKGRIRNIPASRFLRPFMPRLALLEPLRMRRIKKAMTHAAKNGEVFHLWWHPHNFGVNQERNFKNLEAILAHYKILKETYGMGSASLEDIVELSENVT